jgi:hypothetical protein
MRKTYGIIVMKDQGCISCERYICGWDYNIKRNLEKCGVKVDRIQ